MSFLYAIETVLGIGLLIFVHELGHFLAARWSGVRVDAFSLGFGPVLFARQKGATEYRLSLIPIGGYVKLAGELPNEERTGAPDELFSKSIGTRAFIFSAGVLMNLAVALLLFPLVFLIGVPFLEPVAGTVTPGSPAWEAGLEPGDRILEVDGSPAYGFESIFQAFALASEKRVRFLVEKQNGERQELWISRGERFESPASLGISPILDREFKMQVDPESSAARAGMQSGDRLLSIQDQTLSPTDVLKYQELLSQGKTIDIEFERAGERKTVRVSPEPVFAARKQIGVHPPQRKVMGLRGQWLESGPLQKGDFLLSVDSKQIWKQDDLKSLLAADQEYKFSVRRNQEIVENRFVFSNSSQIESFLQDIALGQDHDSLELVPVPGFSAERAGMQAGDRILMIDQAPVSGFSDIVAALQNAKGTELSFVVQRGSGGDSQVINLVVTPSAPLAHGFTLSQSYYHFRTKNLGEAITVGLRSSWQMVEDLYMSVKKMITGEVSPKHVLGGILTIGGTAFHVSQLGFTKLLFFLAILSLNLAILNILPIPILDGGHLFFLMIEKIKGSPVSEKVLGYSQVFGLVLLLALMIFATYNDIQNIFLK